MAKGFGTGEVRRRSARIRWATVALVLAACGASFAAMTPDKGVSAKAPAGEAPAEKPAAEKTEGDKAAPAKPAADGPASDAEAGEKASVDIEKARSALQEWVKQRQMISREKRDWAVDKQLLTERLNLVNGQVDSLRQNIAKVNEEIAKAEKDQTGSVAEREKLRKLDESLKDAVGVLEAKTKKLIRRLPPSVRQGFEKLSQQIPDNASAAPPSLTLGTRFMNVVGILDYLNKRNGLVDTKVETGDWPGAGKYEVTVLYIGIARAYYVSSDGKVAGYGCPNADEWVWTSAPSAARDILEALAILKNDHLAAYVKLPVQVH